MSEPTAFERLNALPRQYQSAALAALAKGRVRCKDRWPDLPTIVQTAKDFDVHAEKLAAMFGHILMPVGGPNQVFHNALRGGDPPPRYRYDARLQPYFDFFRAFVGQDVEPLERRSPIYR